MYGSGSGSGSFYYNQAKIVRKPLISSVLWLLHDFVSLKSNQQKNLEHEIIFSCHHWRKYQDLDSYPDPNRLVRGTDPYQNVTDPQHWLYLRYFNTASPPPPPYYTVPEKMLEWDLIGCCNVRNDSETCQPLRYSSSSARSFELQCSHAIQMRQLKAQENVSALFKNTMIQLWASCDSFDRIENC
jgi:hypothetical protein